MFEEIKGLLIEIANVDDDKITLDARLKEDLDIDSLYAVELVLELESTYNIRIEYDELLDLVYVKDVVKLVENKIGGNK